MVGHNSSLSYPIRQLLYLQHVILRYAGTVGRVCRDKIDGARMSVRCPITTSVRLDGVHGSGSCRIRLFGYGFRAVYRMAGSLVLAVTGVENGVRAVFAATTTPGTAHVRTTGTELRARFGRERQHLARMRRA